MKSGAEVFVDVLDEHHVNHVFVYPGGAIAFILDEIKRRKRIKIINTRSDQATSLCADAYSRATDSVGICMATSGPGATNLITGIGNAYLDSIPMIAITGQVKTHDLKGVKPIRQSGFQELDIVSVVKPITKWAITIKETNRIKYILNKAFDIAMDGRQGPVLLDIPMDIQTNKAVQFDKFTAKKSLVELKEDLIKEAVLLISKSKKPVLYVGGGVISANASDALTKFAKKLSIPVATSLMGKGAFPEHNKLSLGMIGYVGSRACNFTISSADLVIAIGARFDVRATGSRTKTFAKNAKIIHVDIDNCEIGNRVRADLKINGDAKEFLEKINKENIEIDTKEWLVQVDSWKKDYWYSYEKDKKVIKGQEVVEALSDLANGKWIVTADVGQNQMWVAQYFKFDKPRLHLSSGGSGCMGYGLPAAIAAKIAQPKTTVVNITGDGSFQMNIQELETIKYYKLPVKIIILNNHCLGLVRQFQEYVFDKRYTCTVDLYSSPNFTEIAKAYGIKSYNINNPSKLKETLKKAMKDPSAVVVNIDISREEGVLPMLMGDKELYEQFPYIDYKPVPE